MSTFTCLTLNLTAMICLTVLYPKVPGSFFDLEYYLSKHTPLVRDLLGPLGLTGVDIEHGLAGPLPDSPPTYALIVRLKFEDVESLHHALGIHGAELLADIPNFTDVSAVMQISKIVRI